MKKIVSLILLVLSISFVYAQKSEEAVMFERLNLKSIDKSTNVLRVNRSENFQSEAKEADAIALFYLQAKRDVYGLSNNLNDIKVAATVESLSGQYVYCQQYVNDIPVFATNFIIYINKENVITYTLNEFRNVSKYENINSKSLINSNSALQIAKEYLKTNGDVIGKPKVEQVYFESIDNGLELAWKININPVKPVGDWQIFVSASDGHIIHVEDIRMAADGNGQVFKPNPLISANEPYGYCCSTNDCLVNDYGATNSCLNSQLVQVTLKDLTYEGGKYKLKGPYCEVRSHVYYPPIIIPELPTPNFYFTRDQEEFGAVMSYYYVDLAARRILELGYNVPNELKNIRVYPHGERTFDAHYWVIENYITLGTMWFDGKISVPSCEDPDMILHEYGHAIQSIFVPTGMSASGETQAVKEGCSDYWATSYKRSLYSNNWAKLALWRGMGVPLRELDRDWKYPQYSQGYIGSQVWSSALMKIWGDLGRDITDKLFLETHLIWGYSPSLPEAATAFMQADLNLFNGAHLCQIYSRFNEHGLIDATQIVNTTSFVNQTVNMNKIVFSCSDLFVKDVTIKSGATLILKAAGNVIIEGDFDIELGAGFEIW